MDVTIDRPTTEPTITDALKHAAPQLLRALAAHARAQPLARKLLVCERPAHGRELLRTLAARGEAWIGYDVTTPARLAAQLVAADLAVENVTATDEFDELALLDAAMDEVLGASTEGLAALSEGYGLRQAIGHAVRGLRLAGVTVPALERARFRDEAKRAQIAAILAAYERLLGTARADTAAMLRRAVAGLAVGTLTLPYEHVCIVPGQSRRGLAGQLLDVLVQQGAHVLQIEPVFGLDAPPLWLAAPGTEPSSRLSWLHDPAHAPAGVGDVDIRMFVASSVAGELREVLRRVLAAGLRWDEVEIIAADALAYGVALDGLTRRLGVPVSYGSGLPVARTRPGRAVAKYLEWVQGGFPADVLRQMLEHGDIAAPHDAGVSGTALGRLLRRLKVGRGRERYEAALQRHERALAQPQAPEDDRAPEEFAAARVREGAELHALAGVLRPLLAATPGTADAHGVSPAQLAAGLDVLLDMVRPGTSVDATARERLRERVRRIAATLHRPMPLDAVLAVVTAKLDDRVPAPNAPGSAPWTPSGGFLHLSDLDHGGYSGRRATFIVGLDAGRFPGGRFSDALLVDDDRRRIIGEDGAALPLAAERLDERRYRFAALVARLRGLVTFSYAGWDAVEGRAVAPAAELLQVYRLITGNATADYQAMHEALEPAASPLPQRGACIDADDVWFDALSANGRLQAGIHIVEQVHPELRAGVQGFRDRGAPVPGPRHGVIRPRPQLDPRDDPARVVSASQLQVLGTCPHRYLLQHVLRVRVPDDPEPTLETWLTDRDRGALMHRVYERALSAAREDRLALGGAAFEARVLDILDDEAARLREEVPPPGDAIYRMECELLRDDARAFVAMVRQDGDRHIALEEKFGRDGAPPVPVRLPDGRVLHLRGAVDRIDQLADGSLVVIDYKTGRRNRFGPRNGAYDGGRRLQHVLYAAVAEVLHGAAVVRAEYHFPTRESENYRAPFEAGELHAGLGVVSALLDMAARGEFVPTNEPDDCAWCDYAAVCRVRDMNYGRIDSPLAQWSRNVESELLDVLRELRR